MEKPSESRRGGGALKEFKYAKMLTAVANREQPALTVDLDDLEEFTKDSNENLVENIEKNTNR